MVRKLFLFLNRDFAIRIGFVIFLIGGLAGLATGQVVSINGQIAYTVCGSSFDPCDIWVMQSDGTGQTNLTNTPDLNETNPAWSPDGSRIAYMEGDPGSTRLMVMNADGTGTIPVTPDPSYQFEPSWSPGGSQIVLVRLLPGVEISPQFDLVVINADGSGEINITKSDYDELDPAWSPDGANIAFAGVRPEWTVDPETGDPTEAAQWEIVSVNPDGSGEQILSAGDPGTDRALYLEEDRWPAWSPDSTHLVFASQSVDPCCDSWKILSTHRDGTGITLLSDNPDVNDFAPSFSPDGTLILFTSDRDATYGGEFDIYSIPVPVDYAPTKASAALRLTSTGNSTHGNWGRTLGSLPVSQTFPLFVSRIHTGKKIGGKVISSPSGIKCGHDCSQSFTNGMLVTLTAKPRKKAVFGGWSGACASAGTQLTCTVAVDDAKVVGARFIMP